MSVRRGSSTGLDRLRTALVPVVLVLLAAALYVLGIRPLEQERARLQARLQEKLEELAWMQEAARRLDGAPRVRHARPGTPGESSVLALVEGRARAASIPVKRLLPEGAHGVRVELGPVAFDDLVTWFAALESRDGLRLGAVRLQRAETQGRVAGDVRIVTGHGAREEL